MVYSSSNRKDTMGKSIMEEISELPPEEQEAILAEYDPEDLMWDWRMWGRPEQIAPEGDWSVWLYLAGRGCVAGETEIFDAITGETRTIAEWAERGESISVYTPFGYEVTDGAPFIKGTDHLWRVEFSSGTSILVTAQHLFLRGGQWVPLADITPGDAVAAMEPDLRDHGPYSVAKPFIPLVGDAAHRANLAAIAEHEDKTMVEGRSLRSQYADVSRHDPTTTVVRITHARHDSFYDLTVPIAGAYFAHGVLNHNSGKTRSAAEWIREIGMSTKDGPQRIALVARTAGDVRDVVVEGESGLLNVHAPSERPKYEPSKRKITWANGNTATTFTADEPDSLRGPQFSASWGDEVAAWRQTPDAAGMTAFDNLRVATRLGSRPRLFVTTTPKRVPLLHKLLEDHENDPTGIVVSRGSTFDNMSNLSAGYLDTMQGIYGGTALGAQELLGEMLDAQDGAMWNEELIDKYRDANHKNTMPPLRVVAVDPSVAENPKDECGIVVVGSTAERELFRRHAWVLEDATVLGAPDVWARRVVDMARQYRCPVVAEVNQGGALVAAAIHNIDPNIVVHEVHSKQGKSLRAEPVVMTYQQGRVHHRGYLGALESQMNTWIPGDGGKSPDRIDALVHGLTALLIRPPKGLNAGTVQARTAAAQKLGLTRRVTRPTRR